MAATPPLVPTLASEDDGSYFPPVHNDAIEAAMLEELAHERCHEGNPFFALSCRCNFLFVLASQALTHVDAFRESGVVVASPMLRPQGVSQLSRRRLVGDSVSDLNPQELLRVRA
jgi:hypothetical protein